jgi:hypothetical protein
MIIITISAAEIISFNKFCVFCCKSAWFIISVLIFDTGLKKNVPSGSPCSAIFIRIFDGSGPGALQVTYKS